MVWVELHENEASRATDHKKFYEATTGNGQTYCEFRKKKHQNS